MSNNNGRTFADLIHENKKTFIFLIIFLVLAICFLAYNGKNIKTPIASIEDSNKNSIQDTIIEPQKPKIKKNPSDTKSVQTINVTSNNQSGGITANNVTIGKTSRSLQEEEKVELKNILVDKTKKISIITVMGDTESFQHGKAVLVFLKSEGYVNVGYSQVMFATPVTGQFIRDKGDEMEITIGSLKN